jgi:hypothetical protein
LIRVAFSAPAARTLNSFTATTAPAVASTASANAAHGEGRANATTRSRPSCRAELDDGGVDIPEGIDAPGKLVVKKIQAVEGITWTLTCPAVRL